MCVCKVCCSIFLEFPAHIFCHGQSVYFFKNLAFLTTFATYTIKDIIFPLNELNILSHFPDISALNLIKNNTNLHYTVIQLHAPSRLGP